MFEFADRLVMIVPAFLLTFTRISAMIISMPILSYPMLSNRLRITLAMMMTFVLFPMIDSTQLEITSLSQLAIATTREALIGLMLGVGTRLLFEAFSWAGGFMGRQMGIAMANVMDPTSPGQIPVISQFWLLVIVVYFFTINGHHMLFSTLYRNFEVVPVGTGFLSAESGRLLMGTGATAFKSAFQFSAPAIVFLLLLDTGIAFTARIMPQMNIFMVTLPLKISMGLVVLVISLDMFEMIFDIIYQDMQTNISETLNALKGA